MIPSYSSPSTLNRTSNSLLFPNRIRQVVGLVLLLGVGLLGTLGVPATFAQTATEASPETASERFRWRATFDHQAAQKLRQKPSLRGSFLKVVIEVANKKEDVELSRTVDALLHIIDNDPHREHRLMAVQALTTIGPGHIAAERYREAMARLYALMQEESSDQVRSAAAQSLLQST